MDQSGIIFTFVHCVHNQSLRSIGWRLNFIYCHSIPVRIDLIRNVWKIKTIFLWKWIQIAKTFTHVTKIWPIGEVLCFGWPENARPKLGFPNKQIPDFSLLKMKRSLSLWEGFFSANEGGGHPMYIFMKQKEMINKGKIHVFVITISRTRLYRFQPVQINLSPIKNQFF